MTTIEMPDGRLLPENAEERRMFDSVAETFGGPLLLIANAAITQARTLSTPGASFYEGALIYHNELVKAHAELVELRKRLGKSV